MDSKGRRLLLNSILVATLIMGASNFFAQFIIENFTPDPAITVTFMGLAGIIIGARGRQSK
jgi:hypothetical protein